MAPFGAQCFWECLGLPGETRRHFPWRKTKTLGSYVAIVAKNTTRTLCSTKSTVNIFKINPLHT